MVIYTHVKKIKKGYDPSKKKENSSMKRVRTLQTAKKVGWLAEFPEEIYEYMLHFMLQSIRKEKAKFAFMLIMINTCKMFFRILQEAITVLLCDFVNFDVKYTSNPFIKPGMKKIPYFVRICEVFNMIESHTDSREYLRTCLIDDVYHDIEHLSNCLSLLHLANQEGHYLCKVYLSFKRVSIILLSISLIVSLYCI